MSRLLTGLRDVPDDEADEVRALLHEHGIEFYETPPHHWGVSAGGIWIRDDGDFARAEALFDDYQQQRAQRARDERCARGRPGDAGTFRFMLRRHPGRVLFFTGLALGILVLVIWPFWQFARG